MVNRYQILRLINVNNAIIYIKNWIGLNDSIIEICGKGVHILINNIYLI